VQRDAGLHGQRAVDRVEGQRLHAFEAEHEFAVRRDRAAGKPVRPPDGTSATRSALAQRTIACTSSIDAGSAIASGAGVQRRVQSRP
jgi:hypothetical protein